MKATHGFYRHEIYKSILHVTFFNFFPVIEYQTGGHIKKTFSIILIEFSLFQSKQRFQI